MSEIKPIVTVINIADFASDKIYKIPIDVLINSLQNANLEAEHLRRINQVVVEKLKTGFKSRFGKGDKIQFKQKGENNKGIIKRVNPKTYSLHMCSDVKKWRIGHSNDMKQQ